MVPQTLRRRFGMLLLGLGLLLTLASPAGAQTFPDPVRIGFAPNASYVDLYYRLGVTAANIVLPAATGGTGDLTYSLSGGHTSLGFSFDPATRTLSGRPTLAGAGPTHTI